MVDFPLDEGQLAPDPLEKLVDELRDMGRMHGLSDEQIETVVANFLAAKQTELPEVCGRWSKDGRGLICALAPHPDEPFRRTPHAAKADGRAVSWLSPLTLPEQVAAETAKIQAGQAEVCAARCDHDGVDLRCIRAEHGPDVEHAQWTPYEPDPAVGPQPGDPESILTTWTDAA